jgi:hypothetical protein
MFLRSKNAPKIKKVPLNLYQDYIKSRIFPKSELLAQQGALRGVPVEGAAEKRFCEAKTFGAWGRQCSCRDFPPSYLSLVEFGVAGLIIIDYQEDIYGISYVKGHFAQGKKRALRGGGV